MATDFDRTLVWTDAVLHERTIAAMRRAHEAGLPVIVVTGRMVQSIRKALEPAGIEAPVISYQGAVVADADGTWLRHEPLPLELARETIAALADEGYSPNVYVDDELYVAEDTEQARAYADLNRIDFHVVGPLLDWLAQPPTKLVAVGDPAALDDLEPRLKARFGDREYISKSLPHFLEFAQKGVTKGAGLDFLAEHMGFDKAHAIAFGDGENDIELVEWPAYGIAMENATERVKAVARWVCPAAAEQGVAQVLEALLDLKA
ncbi:MAG TPA: Cof-type HAD-IIB family hydrolase [Gaiellaceae bacterium]|nr:Cof-type HAD-IIB family hydrolase [Gaiellaceae bacterium]